MTVEMAGILITAIATAVSALLMYVGRKDLMRRSKPPVRAQIPIRIDEFAVVYLRIYPTDHDVSIRHIYTSGQAIGKATSTTSEWGQVFYKPAHEHFSCLDIELDLLPANLRSTPIELALSIKLSSTQTCFQISLHSNRKRWINQHKITAITIKQTD